MAIAGGQRPSADLAFGKKPELKSAVSRAMQLLQIGNPGRGERRAWRLKIREIGRGVNVSAALDLVTVPLVRPNRVRDASLASPRKPDEDRQGPKREEREASRRFLGSYADIAATC